MSFYKALQDLTVYPVLPPELPLVNCSPRNLLGELKGHGSSPSNDFLLLRDAVSAREDEAIPPSTHQLERKICNRSCLKSLITSSVWNLCLLEELLI